MPAFIPFVVGAAGWAGRLALTFGRTVVPSATAQTIINTADPANLAGATLSGSQPPTQPLSTNHITAEQLTAPIDFMTSARLTDVRMNGGKAICTPFHPNGVPSGP